LGAVAYSVGRQAFIYWLIHSFIHLVGISVGWKIRCKRNKVPAGSINNFSLKGELDKHFGTLEKREDASGMSVESQGKLHRTGGISLVPRRM
jgi:hypothetical protein